ncbi:MAG: urease accessory protein UreD [Anaerolinea sp.]|nr:urease accessory protein UreD [Anaerolinea sp.]CAG1005347.1 Urease accessory protein UreD [Anaerolineae bacterium]
MPANGKLHLIFERDRETPDGACITIMRPTVQNPPLRVIRSFPVVEGGALAHLHNISGGVLGGDQLECQVEVKAGAYVQLTTTGATRVYRGSSVAHQLTTIQVGTGALCEYLPDAIIPYAGSSYRQQTRITLEPDAGLFWWEIVAPGREAFGEHFDYEQLQLETDLYAGEIPLALERIRLQPHQRPPSSQARLGNYPYWATFYICQVSAVDWLALEERLTQMAKTLSSPASVIWACSTLPAHGISIRALGKMGRALYDGLVEFWHAARESLYGSRSALPRKIY